MLYETDPRYRELWNGDPAAVTSARRLTGPCANLGDPTGETRECRTCGGHVRIKLRACTVHGACTEAKAVEGVACCQGCPDRTAAPPAAPASFAPARRHLLYHVWPVARNGTWQRNLDQLAARLPLFDGRRVIAVATGGGADPPDAVREHLRGAGCEFIEVPNDPGLREVATWRPLWDRLADLADTDDVVFYAHAKGVTRPFNPGVTVHEWARILYSSLLDFWPVVDDLLRRHPIAGSFKKIGHGFQGSKSAWHYSGAFFWVRLREALAYSRADTIDGRWWGSEAWPGLHWRPEEAGCVFQEGRVPTLDLYSPDVLFRRVVQEFRDWTGANARRRTRHAAGAAP